MRGRVRRITIGQYPAVSVGFAREEALRIKSAITQGRDPVVERTVKMGYPTKVIPELGAVSAIRIRPGELDGAFDPRKGGAAVGN